MNTASVITMTTPVTARGGLTATVNVAVADGTPDEQAQGLRSGGDRVVVAATKRKLVVARDCYVEYVGGVSGTTGQRMRVIELVGSNRRLAGLRRDVHRLTTAPNH